MNHTTHIRRFYSTVSHGNVYQRIQIILIHNHTFQMRRQYLENKTEYILKISIYKDLHTLISSSFVITYPGFDNIEIIF